MGSLTTLCKSTEVEAEGYNRQLFPKLKEVILNVLPSLERWMENSAGQPDSLLMFPMLQELEIRSCPKLASIPGSPVLKKLKIGQCCSFSICALAHLTALSELESDETCIVPTSMPLGSCPSLVKLKLRSSLEDRENKSQGQRSLQIVRSLRSCDPTCFIPTSGLPKSHLRLWECFDFVEELVIFSCLELFCWPVEELRTLVCLRTLEISMCDYLEGNGSSSESLLLPHLEKLRIYQCESLLEIPKLHAPLEYLAIIGCQNLVALPSNLGDLAKLRDLYLVCCLLKSYLVG
jgi:hypothetical protein